MTTQNWHVYLILNETGRTYIGSTTDVLRRLRQHNGEIRGGARSTRGHYWQIHCYLSGFESRSEACRWERILKCRCRGLWGRSLGFHQVWAGQCPPSRTGREYSVPKSLHITAEGRTE